MHFSVCTYEEIGTELEGQASMGKGTFPSIIVIVKMAAIYAGKPPSPLTTAKSACYIRV